MKKTLFCLSAIVMLGMWSCKNAEQEKQMEEQEKTISQLQSNYDEATTFNDSLMLLMSDIYAGLDSINMQEGLLYNMGYGEGFDRRQEIRDNLSAIKERLAANHELLNKMEERLRASGNENTVLSKTIEQMQFRLDQQDSRIVNLENQLSAANDSITRLNRKVDQAQMQAQIQSEAKEAAFKAYETADQQLNTVYYAMGTTKELKDNGLLEKKFLRSTKVLEGDFDQNYFTSADKRVLTKIETGAKKIKILTNQPAGSYEEIKNEDKTITLKITNPEEFWRLSPYLLIELK